jgi:hypothetical protein
LLFAGVIAPGALGAANTATGGAGAVPAMNAAGAMPAVNNAVGAAGADAEDFGGDNWFNEAEPVGTGGGGAIGTGTLGNVQQPVGTGMNAVGIGGGQGVAGAGGAANDGFGGDWFAENAADDNKDGLNDQALFGSVLDNTGANLSGAAGGTAGAAGGVNRGANPGGAAGTGIVGTDGTGVGAPAAPGGTGIVAPNLGK